MDLVWERFKLPNVSSDVVAYSAKLPPGFPRNFTTLFASGERAIRARYAAWLLTYGVLLVMVE